MCGDEFSAKDTHSFYSSLHSARRGDVHARRKRSQELIKDEEETIKGRKICSICGGPASVNDCLQANLEHGGAHLQVPNKMASFLDQNMLEKPEKVAPGYMHKLREHVLSFFFGP